MDIRSFLIKKKSDEDNASAVLEPQTSKNTSVSYQVNSTPECSTSINTVPTSTINYTPNDCESYPDLGLYINKSNLSDELKYKLLTKPYIPSDNYDFKNDSIAQKRNFKIEWLKQYRWLVYSRHLKGGLCKHCVVFRPVVKRGLLGAFIVSEFTKYKDFHFHAKKHMQSEWHRDSVSQSTDFLKIMSNKEKSVIDQLNTAQHSQIEQNRKKLVPILSSIIFCATHDLAIRGKLSCSGNFHDLLKFRVESGDSVLSEHLSTCHSKAKYTSHRIQNELILLSGNVLCDQIVREVNSSLSFSLLADETSDIAGIEQLSIGVRYVDSSKTIREEFIGFSALQTLDAVGIATSILTSVEKYGLDMNKLVGLGFDGCSVMAGKENGVQKIICDKYSKATFFHCASHRLNLVVNDLNAVTEIQNTVGVIKEVINFFRESVLRRKLVTNVPLLCDTRWSAKYKSIRIFAENFINIKSVLEKLSHNNDSDFKVNTTTRTKAHQLSCATSTSQFIISLNIISKYSAQLEPVTNKLQAKSIDLYSVQNHIQDLLTIFNNNREQSNIVFNDIFNNSIFMAEKIGAEIKIPRITSKQKNRSNYETDSAEHYYRLSIFIPYLDSLISSLSRRFSSTNKIAFSISLLHPTNIKNYTINDFKEKIKLISDHYEIENMIEESNIWYQYWIDKNLIDSQCDEISFVDLLAHCEYYPAIFQILNIFISLPPTTCTIERSFSTLRRVKTWLRSTTGEDRLNGLCMMSLHRERVNGNKDNFIQDVINIDTSQNTNLLGAISEVTTTSDSYDSFSKLKGYQVGTNNVACINKEIAKNYFVNASTLNSKAKKKASETDLYLKQLHEIVLPRCQSADITSDIVKRDIYADIPSKTIRRLQPEYITSKPISSTQEKRVHFNNSSGCLGRTNNPHQLNDSSKSIELLSKNDCQNVSIMNVNFEDNISDEKYTNNCKANKLKVQQIFRVNLKPDLVTQKLANIQIKRDNKKLLRNYKPNVAYQEFAFGLEPETCKCDSVVQPKISNDKIVARHEIRKIICGMLDNTSSNYSLSDRLISQLQKIITKLEKTKSQDYNDSSEVEDLIEEHSMVGFSEEVIKSRLLEIADNLEGNEIDGISFDQMSVDIENDSRQVLKRLTKIKNSIVALNPLVEFPSLPTDNKLKDAAKYVDGNLPNHHPSNILFTKNHHEIPSTQFVSVKDFLRHGYNFTSLEIFKNTSVLKECGSKITLCSNDNINQNQNIFKTQNALNNQNNISQLKKHQLKFQDQSTLFEDSVLSQPRSSHSSIILKHQLKSPDDDNQNNDKNYGFTTTGYDWEAENSLKINSGINTVCKTNNDVILTKSDQLTKFEKDKNTKMLKINTNIEHLPMNDTSKDYENLKSNIQWCQSLSSLTSDNFQQTDKVQILDKRTQSSASTTSSMVSLKQSTQEVESEAESSTSLGEVNYFSK